VTLGAFVRLEIVRKHRHVQGRRQWGSKGRWWQMFAWPDFRGAVSVRRRTVRPRAQPPDRRYGGVVNTMPVFAAFMVLFALANTGLPGTSGFVGEFLVIIASFRRASGTRCWRRDAGAGRGLHAVAGKRVIFGRSRARALRALEDLNGRECIVLTALALAVLVVGVWPAPLLKVMQPSIQHMVSQAIATKL